MNILITGGAGYIGSHVVKQFGNKENYTITVIDNLSTGFKDSVLNGELITEDLGNLSSIERIFRKKEFNAVLHFAASIEVEESVDNPLKYYKNNTVNSINLIDLCVKYNVNYFVFSSTAAIYGNPGKIPVGEDDAKVPLNPYGMSKLMIEKVLEDTAGLKKSFRYCVLRYFNVAGADKDLMIGQKTRNATHLIKAACQASLGLRSEMAVFGTDYNTPDGTGVRDYIHVDDLAMAHLKALDYIRNNQSNTFNCGYGSGYSVKEVIAAVKKVSGVDFKVIESGRRSGDSAIVVANNKKIIDMIGWVPQYNNLEYICKTAFEWEKKCCGLLDKDNNSVKR